MLKVIFWKCISFKKYKDQKYENFFSLETSFWIFLIKFKLFKLVFFNQKRTFEFFSLDLKFWIVKIRNELLNFSLSFWNFNFMLDESENYIVLVKRALNFFVSFAFKIFLIRFVLLNSPHEWYLSSWVWAFESSWSDSSFWIFLRIFKILMLSQMNWNILLCSLNELLNFFVKFAF